MYQQARLPQVRHAPPPSPGHSLSYLGRDAAANNDPRPARRRRRPTRAPLSGLTIVALVALAPATALAWPFTTSPAMSAPASTATPPATTPAPITPPTPVGRPYVTPSSAAPIVDTPALPPAPGTAAPTTTTTPPGTHAAPPTPGTPVSPAAAASPTGPATTAPATTPPGTHAAAPTPDVPVGPAAAAPTAAGEEAAGKAGDVPLALGFHGAMEFYYAYNTNRPSNDITNFRWYDHRHNQQIGRAHV